MVQGNGKLCKKKGMRHTREKQNWNDSTQSEPAILLNSVTCLLTTQWWDITSHIWAFYLSTEREDEDLWCCCCHLALALQPPRILFQTVQVTKLASAVALAVTITHSSIQTNTFYLFLLLRAIPWIMKTLQWKDLHIYGNPWPLCMSWEPCFDSPMYTQVVFFPQLFSLRVTQALS